MDFPLKSRLPSAGFLWLCGTAAFAAVFFAWGLREPGLDRVWKLLHELKIGKKQCLSSGDLRLLRDTLRSHPDLSPAILDGAEARILSANTEGWIETEAAYLLIAPGPAKAARLKFRWRPSGPPRPAAIILSGDAEEVRISAEKSGEVDFEIPESLRSSMLIEIRLEDSGGCGGLKAGMQVLSAGGGGKG